MTPQFFIKFAFGVKGYQNTCQYLSKYLSILVKKVSKT